MNDRDELIQTLAADLKPVQPVAPAGRMALFWFAGSCLYLVLVTHLIGGPIRPEAFQQLVTVPRFLFEQLLGLAGLLLLALALFRSAIPGLSVHRLVDVSVTLLVLWLLQFVIGLWDPALEPSMSGKRDGCLEETLVYCVPPMVIGLVMIRRLYPLQPLKSALWCCLVAGLLPALYMQIACMYVVPHILKFHIFPGILMALVGFLVVWVSVGRKR